jgi:hypothetical protein
LRIVGIGVAGHPIVEVRDLRLGVEAFPGSDDLGTSATPLKVGSSRDAIDLDEETLLPATDEHLGGLVHRTAPSSRRVGHVHRWPPLVWIVLIPRNEGWWAISTVPSELTEKTVDGLESASDARRGSGPSG